MKQKASGLSVYIESQKYISKGQILTPLWIKFNDLISHFTSVVSSKIISPKPHWNSVTDITMAYVTRWFMHGCFTRHSCAKYGEPIWCSD